MVQRILWNKDETIILLDNYLRSLKGKITKEEAIYITSNELRSLAMAEGLEIDSIFRNESGIIMQMSKIQDVFNKSKNRLSKPPQVFYDTVDLYHRNRYQYDNALKKSQEKIVNYIIGPNSKNTNSKFYQWLSKKIKYTELIDIYCYSLKLDNWNKTKGRINKALYEVTDSQIIKQIRKEIFSDSEFIYLNKNWLNHLKLYFNYYLEFLDWFNKTEEKNQLKNPVLYNKITIDTTFKYQSLANELGLNISETIDERKYYLWLIKYENFSEPMAKTYCSSLRTIEGLAKQLDLNINSIYGKKVSEVKIAYLILKVKQPFIKLNRIHHNYLSLSLEKYIQYLENNDDKYNLKNTEIESGPEKLSSYNHQDFSTINEQLQDDSYSYNKETLEERCKKIFEEKFSNGFRLNSLIEFKRFVKLYNEEFNEQLDYKDELIKKKITDLIKKYAIQDNNFLIPINKLVDEDFQTRLINYIELKFNEGKHKLYFDAIFNEFESDFVNQRIYDSKILAKYIYYLNEKNQFNNNYHFFIGYFSDTLNFQIDLKTEVIEYLKQQNFPITLKQICKEFSNYPSSQVVSIIRSTPEIICNAPGKDNLGEYFYISIIDLTDYEKQNIINLLNQFLENQKYISISELIKLISEKYPDILEQFNHVSDLGVKNSISFYIKEDFDSTRNIITRKGNKMTSYDVYEEFARTHERFTLDEIKNLKNEIEININFEAIFQWAIRIDQNHFESKDNINFDIEKIDSAVATFLTDDYISLSDVSSFLSFPEITVPWNTFILENYIFKYSKKYKLIHTIFSANNCSGAIVEKTSNIVDFDDLLIRVLTNADIPLTTDDSLNYLCSHGFLTRRKYSNIDEITNQAKIQRGY